MYDRVHSREISAYGGVVNTMPKFAAFMVLFALANSGLPGTSGFVGEFLVIIASFKANFWYAFLAGTHADPGRGLHAVAGQARDLRRGGQRPRRRAAGSQRPRVHRARRAGGRACCCWACGPRRCSRSCRPTVAASRPADRREQVADYEPMIARPAHCAEPAAGAARDLSCSAAHLRAAAGRRVPRRPPRWLTSTLTLLTLAARRCVTVRYARASARVLLFGGSYVADPLAMC